MGSGGGGKAGNVEILFYPVLAICADRQAVSFVPRRAGDMLR